MAERIQTAIVDYRLGNLFSVRNACEHVGITALVTSSGQDLDRADAVILPGVGAFGDAMRQLRELDLVSPILEAAASGKPILGVCLGLQLLMTGSFEFGWHEGLGLIDGTVVRFERPMDGERALKVPQIGWNRIMPGPPRQNGRHAWEETLLAPLADGEHMYFVHSFHARPADRSVVLAVTRYGDAEFCSALARGSITACQFHPERSGPAGLAIYKRLAGQAWRVKRGE